jgi:hypothetical protein
MATGASERAKAHPPICIFESVDARHTSQSLVVGQFQIDPLPKVWNPLLRAAILSIDAFYYLGHPLARISTCGASFKPLI